LEPPLADEPPGEEAEHHPSHRLTDRIRAVREPIDQLLELLLTVRAAAPAGIEGRCYLRDVLDVASNRLVFGPNFVAAAVAAPGQAAQLLLGEPPFFSSRLSELSSSLTHQRLSRPSTSA